MPKFAFGFCFRYARNYWLFGVVFVKNQSYLCEAASIPRRYELGLSGFELENRVGKGGIYEGGGAG